MFDASAISRLYATVLHYDIGVNRVSHERVKQAIRGMALVYRPESTDFQSLLPLLPDYNDIAYRCAYLHKYAPLHTYIVYEVMTDVLKKEIQLFRKLVKAERRFQICSLGGGPGSDVIGVLAALHTALGSFKATATVVDCMPGWEFTFRSVISEVISGDYGTAWNNLAKDFHWRYVATDLLFSLTGEAETAVATSSLVTMIKFVSAAVCRSTDDMINVIFSIMKPGALLLFIDNAGGGFSNLIEKAAEENGFEILFGPLKHEQYIEGTFNVARFGHTSCHSTTVAIFLLQKQLNHLAPVYYNIVDERAPLMPGNKKRKSSVRKKRKERKPTENEIPNTVKVVLPPGDTHSKFGNLQNVSQNSYQDLLDTQPVPNLPRPLTPVKNDSKRTFEDVENMMERSSKKPSQEKQTDPKHRSALLSFNSNSLSDTRNFKPIEPSRASAYSNVPKYSANNEREFTLSQKCISSSLFFPKQTMFHAESNMKVQRIDPKLPSRHALEPAAPVHNSKTHENTKIKRPRDSSQKVTTGPNSTSTLLPTRNDVRSKSQRIKTSSVPVTTQPVPLAGVACSATDPHCIKLNESGGSICPKTSEPKLSIASELPRPQGIHQDSFQAERIIPNSTSASTRNGSICKSKTLEGIKRSSLPVTTQPVSVAGIACSAMGPRRSKLNGAGGSICPKTSDPKTSYSTELPTSQDKSCEASRIMYPRTPPLLEKEQNKPAAVDSWEQGGNFPAPSNTLIIINNYSTPNTSQGIGFVGAITPIPNYSSCSAVTIQSTSVAHTNARSDPKPPQRIMENMEDDSCCPCFC